MSTYFLCKSLEAVELYAGERDFHIDLKIQAKIKNGAKNPYSVSPAACVIS